MRGRGKLTASVPSNARKRQCSAYSSHLSDLSEDQAASESGAQLSVPHPEPSCNQPWTASLESVVYHNSPGSFPVNSSLSATTETRQVPSSPRERCCSHRQSRTPA